MMRRILMILLAIGLNTIGMTAQKSAMEVVNAMSPGWNLGNTFEASSGQGALFNNKAGLNAETSWQGTKTTPELIDFVKAQGQLVADDLSASLPSGIYIYQNEKLAIK